LANRQQKILTLNGILDFKGSWCWDYALEENNNEVIDTSPKEQAYVRDQVT
jgi:hypothetical protein